MSIGIIGLGLLGRAIAQRLLQSGHTVCGYDISAEALDEAVGLGVTACADARAVAASADTVFLCLLTSDDRRELLWGTQQLSASLRTGSLLLDASTSRPSDLVEDHRKLAEHGVKLVDVCVSGSSLSVTEGKALALVGDQEAEASYSNLLKAFTNRQYYFGEAGRGNRAKLIVNLVFGLHRLVLAEALGLAEHDGFDLDLVLDVLRQGDTYSAVMDTKGPMMVGGKYTPPVARLSQHAKDVGLIQELARELGSPIPVTQTHATLIESLVAQGYGELDNAAIFKAYRSG